MRTAPFHRVYTALAVGVVFMLVLMGAEPSAHAGDLDFSDPAKLPPPPPYTIGFPSRDPRLDVRPGFVAPPPGYREVPFYWWLGDPLTKERLKWQLDQLDRVKGVMGLQVNYAHSDRGGRSYGLTYPSDPPLFSEAWWDLFRWFMAEGKKRGMAASLSDYTLCTPGQGQWTDEIIKENPGICGAVLQSAAKEAAGGRAFSWDLPENTLSVVAFRLKDGAMEPGSAVDLGPQVSDRKVRWSAPEGQWKVVTVSFRRVPLSIDPMNPLSGKEYVEKFFQRFEDRCPGEGGKGLNFFFSDELNLGVNGKMWTARFAEEFRRRKGYDLLPELPALFEDIGPRTPKVRLDYSDVLVALSEESFFRPIFEWHYSRGMVFGCDHGGRGRNVTEFGDYFRTQRWMTGPGCDQPKLASDVVKNKVASSIAHLYQRPRTWLEGYHSSGWGTTTAELIDATFDNFVMGQNLLTLHGLYYSTHGGWWEWAPPCNHFRMPYWPHMQEFFGCVERLSFLLSQGVHCCDVAIVYPVAPVEAEMGGKESVQTAFNAGDQLYRQGIDFDFIDFESLARATIEDRKLRVSGEAYRVLVLPAMQAVRFSTMMKAAEFARAGGVVMALGALPEASDRAGRGDVELDAMVKGVFGLTAQEAKQGKPAVTRKGLAGFLVEKPEQAAHEIEAAIPRDFVCLAKGPGSVRAYVMHRKIGARDLFMVYGAPYRSECSFHATGKVELWDPWTGNSRPLCAVAQTAGSTTVIMPLTDKEAQLIVFSPGAADISIGTPETTPDVVSLDGDWEFELKPTMDNRFGDFSWPPSPTLIGAEARRFRYADETVLNPGWQVAAFDDSMWTKVTASFGPRFWKLGPLPENVDAAVLEAHLAAIKQVDPSVPVDLGGKQYRWQRYEFSMRWGIENDPGHQGYHGLKELVGDDFIGLGRLKQGSTGTTYEKEDGGTRYYLWSSVVSPAAGPANILVGDLKPAKVWLNGLPLATSSPACLLLAGPNPLLLRYDTVGRGHFVVESAQTIKAEGVPMAMSWYQNPGVLPFDIRPAETRPAGWYRFTAPPGLRTMTVIARSQVQAWADGQEMTTASGRQLADGSFEFKAYARQPFVAAVNVALRIEQERGFYGGSALPESITLDCGAGQTLLGDWSKQGVLETYSGGAWYRKTVGLTAGQIRGRLVLDLGDVAASAEVHVNGRLAGVRISPPWRLDITEYVKAGANRIEVLVYSTLANHYATLPTRYRGSLASGLLGPVRIEIEHPITQT